MNNNEYMNNKLNNPIYFNNGINSNRSIINSIEEYIPNEQSYLENILRLNTGKRVFIHQSFPVTNEEKNFTGIIEQCGKDHIILSDPNTGNWYLLLMSYLNFIEFDEEINTQKQFYSSMSKNY